MTAIKTRARALAGDLIRDGHGLQGAQITAALLLAYGLSRALGLPESFWAVMSSLIVMRPNADATLDAGWQRVAGSAGGALCGLAGAWLLHAHGVPPAATLALVAALAFATAGWPMLRSAPITALIVLSSAGMAGHSPLRVAVLRLAEIGLGVAAGLAVAWGSRLLRATPPLAAVCAALLRQLAAQLQALADGQARTPEAREADGAATRATLRHLGFLVQGSKTTQHRQLLGLCMRLSQDAAVLLRALEAAPDRAAEARATAADAARALAAAAAHLAGTGRETPAPGPGIGGAGAPLAWPVLPAQWLGSDLLALQRVAARLR